MKKIYSLFLALVGLCMFVPAKADNYRSVVFSRVDGTTMALTVESGMSTIVADGAITMSCEIGIVSLPTSEITKWTFSTEPGMDFGLAGIDAPEADLVEVVVSDGFVTLNGLPAGSKVMLTAIDGRVVASMNANGQATLSTDGLRGGVYILTFNDKSLKIALK